MEMYPRLNVKKENGFTLVELLLSLSVVTVMVLLVVPISLSALQTAEEEQFFRTLESDVLYIQSMAHEDVTFSIRFADDHYTIVRGSHGGTIKRDYPRGLTMETYTNQMLSFEQYGSVRNPRTIHIHTKKGSYRMVFPFGKGRYYIEKR
jgi:competence protein ComGD